MAILNDSLVIQLASPDYQEDWGTVGDPIYATLDRYRKQAGLFEMSVAADSPVRELLMRDGCAVRVMFRGRVEFMGHVYLRQGGVAEDSPVTVFAREETEVLDHTLAWVAPKPITLAGSFGGIYSSGSIEPAGTVKDYAQAFPDPWLDPGHYMWTIPFFYADDPLAWGITKPQTVGAFIGTLMQLNLARVGYKRATLFSADSHMNMVSSSFGAPFKVVSDEAAASWERPVDPVPWVESFPGISPRFQTLREVANAFQDWADEHDDRSFNFYADGDIGIGSYGVRLGYRMGETPYPVPLSVTAGTVVDGDWSVSEHSGSRIILGGPGEQHARLFQERRNADRESYGRVIETFKDATGAKLTAINNTGYDGAPREYFVDDQVPDGYKQTARRYFDQQGARYLNESGPETSISVTLRESGEIYYGGEAGYRLGQKVTIDLGWIEFEKRVERVTISLSKTEGLRVLPYVGSEVATNDEAAARAMRALASHQRRTTSER
ncbi:hypothetical protein QBL02_13005 [Leucobacter sp. UT-8R-CII-1-4]|uniref:Gp37-like protein n=1 Tax=Leucobacter sp. UT-8R-CII-1-4 TaxID=3040075 RepID=UPI0024A90284|nr:hypothetical protein [Leucobacter sp. UT-8R-CII-1-4]MDI6024459.1 hypothetical protein [Leucobacter sp. UT-8R-CII-1-4]